MEDGGLADYLLFVFMEGLIAGLASYFAARLLGGKMMDRDESREGLFESYGETDPGKLEERLINLEDELADHAEKLEEILVLLRKRKGAA